MPDIITHYIFGLDTTQNIKPSPLYQIIKEHRDLFIIGLQGPDPIYYHHLRRKDHKSYIASKMHTEKTGDFLISALCHAKKYKTDSKEFNECLSYLSGFLCHYILDSMAHPYIFYLGGRYVENQPDTHKFLGIHKQLEMAIDAILCEEKLKVKASKLKIQEKILNISSIPQSILTLYDEILFLLYGINNGGAIFKDSYEDLRMYYKVTYDLLGLKKVLAKSATPILPKQFAPFTTTFSYFNCVKSDVDYLNRKKQVWLHPVTGNVYTFSFDDILRNATKKSTRLLLATYDFASSNLSAEDFRANLPNISYLTGLTTEDTRPFKYISETFYKHLK